MSLLICCECQNKVSSYAKFCPHCGCPIDLIKKETNKDENLKVKKKANSLYKQYFIEYKDENHYRKLERALKKYNMLAYKKLYFNYYSSFREGKFEGLILSSNEEKGITRYELKLPTDRTFASVHGEIKLIYSVHEKEGAVILETIMPEQALCSGHQKELTTYKGIMVSKGTAPKDMFKIDLLNMLNKKD